MTAIVCSTCGHTETVTKGSHRDLSTWRCPRCSQQLSFGEDYEDATRAARPEELDSDSLDVARTTDAPSKRPTGDSELSSIPPLNEGERIEHFVIQRLIDRGGFGYVFAAFDEKLERTVALKIPHARRMTEAQKEGFLREARLTAKLNHPNIVSVHEVGETNGRIWIASDLIDGHSLIGYMNRHELSAQQTAEFCAAICSGVEAAHRMRIIHRDIKPGNILIGRDGRLYIADFGLAFRDEPSKDNQAYRLAGTLPYMSPEQLDRTGIVDARSDVYAIGIILYQMLAGERPYKGNRSEIQELIQEARPEPPRAHNPRVSPELEAICLKAIQGRPEARYQTAGEMEADLRKYLAGEPPLAYKPSIAKKTVRWLRINKWPVTAAASILALLALTLFFVISPPNSTKLPVVISTNPPGASIAIVPISKTSFNPEPEKAIQVAGEDIYTVYLEPGMYIVEAVKQVGNETLVQEVVREVPPRLVNSMDTGHAARTFEVDEKKRIIWPSVKLPPTSRNNVGFVEVAGGKFLTGSDLFRLYPLTEVTVAPFLMQANEVSAGEYQQVMGVVPQKMTNRLSAQPNLDLFAVTNVSFYEALEYAERTGSRLPTLNEFLFAATNGGTSKFPWGDDGTMITQWPVDLEQPPAYDVSALGVHGLHSRVAEWTQTGSAGGEMPDALTLEPARMIAGDSTLESGKPNLTTLCSSARVFTAERMNSSGNDGLGFRCARSIGPRFFDSSKKSGR